MFKNVRPTVLLVVLFVLLIIGFFMAEDANAHTGTVPNSPSPHSVSLGVSGGVVNYEGGVTQRLGYEYDRRFAGSYERLGGKGYKTVHSYSVYRVVWANSNRRGLYLSLGATYTDGTLAELDRQEKPLVSDELTFRLGVGYSWELSSTAQLRLGVVHNSTAGRSERNRGIDRAGLTFIWRLP